MRADSAGVMDRKPEIDREYEIIARWRSLAERRLSYLTELYQAGRWQRYYSQAEFLTLMRECVAAVDTWRKLMSGADGHSESAAQMSHEILNDPSGQGVTLAPGALDEPSATAMSQAIAASHDVTLQPDQPESRAANRLSGVTFSD